MLRGEITSPVTGAWLSFMARCQYAAENVTAAKLEESSRHYVCAAVIRKSIIYKLNQGGKKMRKIKTVGIVALIYFCAVAGILHQRRNQ